MSRTRGWGVSRGVRPRVRWSARVPRAEATQLDSLEAPEEAASRLFQWTTPVPAVMVDLPRFELLGPRLSLWSTTFSKPRDRLQANVGMRMNVETRGGVTLVGPMWSSKHHGPTVRR